MFKNKIAAMVAVIMTISSLCTVSFAADGDSYDKLLGNSLTNGSFENGLDKNNDGWGPVEGRVTAVINNTHDGSAGAILVRPGAADASPVHGKFKVTPNKYYHAEAYVMLGENTATKAELVIATINNAALSTSLTTTATAVDVNGTTWTKLECDFVSAVQDLAIYVKFEDESVSYYLDDVVVKSADYRLPGMEKVLVSVEDKDGNRFLAMQLRADGNGAINLVEVSDATKETLPVGGKMISRVMLDKDAQASSPKAKILLQKNTGDVEFEKDETVLLEKGVMTKVVLENDSTTRYRNRYPVLKVSDAEPGDIIYYCGTALEAEEAISADAAVAQIGYFDAHSGANTEAVIVPDANTVAIRYFYYVEGENGNWTKIKTGHTNAGDTSVAGIFLDASYIGKTIKLEIQPMNADLDYGEKVFLTAVVNAPFEAGEITPTVDSAARTVTSNFDVTNISGDTQYVAALVAYYNAKDEMIGIGIENKQIADGDTETFNVTVDDIDPVTGDYSKLYLLDGYTAGSALALFPLAEAK